MMRVLHVYKTYPPVYGGIENHIRLLAEGLASRGLEVTVLVTHSRVRTVVDRGNGPRVIRTGRLFEMASTPLSLGLFSWMRRIDADITHLHFPYPPGEMAHLMFGKSRKLVVTYHSDIVRQKNILRFYRPLLVRLLRRADRIITSSPGFADGSPLLRDPSFRCEVIPLGIDLPALEADPAETAEVRQRHGSPLLLFVGRLRHYKGLEYLIEAMSEIPARLLIVGAGPREPQLCQLAARSTSSARISFLGDVPQRSLAAHYAACDLFVLPASNRAEAFGLVLLEAMAAGRPVISTDVGTGTSWVNQHGKTGWVVPAGNASALADAIRNLLKNPDLRRTMGIAGRERVRALFSKERMVEHTIELYQKVLAESSAGARP